MIIHIQVTSLSLNPSESNVLSPPSHKSSSLWVLLRIGLIRKAAHAWLTLSCGSLSSRGCQAKADK